jgi:hypothetical protein
MPSGRSPPPGFGIITRRTGGGRYVLWSVHYSTLRVPRQIEIDHCPSLKVQALACGIGAVILGSVLTTTGPHLRQWVAMGGVVLKLPPLRYCCVGTRERPGPAAVPRRT